MKHWALWISPCLSDRKLKRFQHRSGLQSIFETLKRTQLWHVNKKVYFLEKNGAWLSKVSRCALSTGPYLRAPNPSAASLVQTPLKWMFFQIIPLATDPRSWSRKVVFLILSPSLLKGFIRALLFWASLRRLIHGFYFWMRKLGFQISCLRCPGKPQHLEIERTISWATYRSLCFAENAQLP